MRYLFPQAVVLAAVTLIVGCSSGEPSESEDSNSALSGAPGEDNNSTVDIPQAYAQASESDFEPKGSNDLPDAVDTNDDANAALKSCHRSRLKLDGFDVDGAKYCKWTIKNSASTALWVFKVTYVTERSGGDTTFLMFYDTHGTRVKSAMVRSGSISWTKEVRPLAWYDPISPGQRAQVWGPCG